MMEGWLPEGGGDVHHCALDTNFVGYGLGQASPAPEVPEKKSQALSRLSRHFQLNPPWSLNQQSPGKKAYVPPRTFLT